MFIIIIQKKSLFRKFRKGSVSYLLQMSKKNGFPFCNVAFCLGYGYVLVLGDLLIGREIDQKAFDNPSVAVAADPKVHSIGNISV